MVRWTKKDWACFCSVLSPSWQQEALLLHTCRLRAAANALQQAAAEASQRLTALEQDVLVAAAAAAEALHTPAGSAKAATTKAAAAARALRLAVKWATASPADGAATGSQLGSRAGPSAAQGTMCAAAALLEQLEGPAALPSSLADACKEHKAAGAHGLQPPVQVWLVQASQHGAQPCGPQPSQEEGRHTSQQQQQQPDEVEEDSCAAQQAAQHGSCQGGCSAVEVFGSRPDAAASLAAAQSAAPGAASAAEQGGLSLDPPESCAPSPHYQPEAAQQPAAAAASADSSSSCARDGQASSVPGELDLAERTHAAAAAMLSKQERALARAAAAGEEWHGCVVMPCPSSA